MIDAVKSKEYDLLLSGSSQTLSIDTYQQVVFMYLSYLGISSPKIPTI